MSDLVKRLRSDDVAFPETCGACEEAADRIETLEERVDELEQAKQDATEAMEIYVERIEALEAALREIGDPLMPHRVSGTGRAWEHATIQSMQKIARAVLAPEPKELAT